MKHLWCASCDVVVKGQEKCPCGAALHKVVHDLDMVDLLMTTQALTGLLTAPADFDPYDWDIDALVEDMDRRDELMAEQAALTSVH